MRRGLRWLRGRRGRGVSLTMGGEREGDVVMKFGYRFIRGEETLLPYDERLIRPRIDTIDDPTPASRLPPNHISNKRAEPNHSQSSSSLSSSTFRDSFGLLGPWLGTPDAAPTTS